MTHYLDLDTSSVVADDVGWWWWWVWDEEVQHLLFSVGTLPYDMEWSQSKITLTNEVEKRGW